MLLPKFAISGRRIFVLDSVTDSASSNWIDQLEKVCDLSSLQRSDEILQELYAGKLSDGAHILVDYALQSTVEAVSYRSVQESGISVANFVNVGDLANVQASKRTG